VKPFDEDNYQFRLSMPVVPVLSHTRLSLGDMLCLLVLLAETFWLLYIHLFFKNTIEKY